MALHHITITYCPSVHEPYFRPNIFLRKLTTSVNRFSLSCSVKVLISSCSGVWVGATLLPVPLEVVTGDSTGAFTGGYIIPPRC